jgi:hypothetical protein
MYRKVKIKVKVKAIFPLKNFSQFGIVGWISAGKVIRTIYEFTFYIALKFFNQSSILSAA